MPDYQNGKIYMLGLPPFLPYYGSTVQTLKARMDSHKNDARAYLKGTQTKNKSSRDLVLRHGCKIELVEDFPCSTKRELEIREGWYQRTYECINKRTAGRTENEYRQYHQAYTRANKEKSNLAKRKHVKCEICGATVCKGSMWIHKKSKKHINHMKQKCVGTQTFTKHI
jgi:hypothetical protein